MAWTSGFFNSMNGDRLYNAQQMSEIFDGLITPGVYESIGNKLAVQPNSGMTVQIATGRGWFGGHWVNNDSVYRLTLESADVTLNRYAAVVIKADDTESVRSVTPYIKYGAAATSPAKPAMTRTSTVKEYCLAYIYIKAGATAITAANIEDTRANTSLCGWVTGLIKQLSSTTLFDQFTAIFTEWFDNLSGNVNDNTEAMLVAALPKSLTVNIPVSNWKDNTATVTVAGMNATKTVLCAAAENTKAIYDAAGVKLTAQNTNMLTFSCSSVPTAAVNANIVHMGV